MAVHFTKLEIYILSRGLVPTVYRLTKKLPIEEKYNLCSQSRRAVSSVGANIAEGCGRFHFKDKTKFMYNARGSLFELEHFVILSRDLHYFTEEEANGVLKIINTLRIKLNNYISFLMKQSQRQSH
ncbi:four helix bundle protein [Patescibacteria group bacterium]|nr:four helix bundle protein [Patescibacteria group bacterium]